jgi:hypothetical protein
MDDLINIVLNPNSVDKVIFRNNVFEKSLAPSSLITLAKIINPF